ncbi:MAG: O-antigen ligase family protein [Clostridiales bacterium]|nr:O-antigen ligase family protein [Clostridiales bacterium]
MALNKNQAIFSFADKFYHSNLYIAIVTLIGVLGFVFRLEIYAIYVVGIIAAIGWVVCRDLLPTFIAMMIISMTPLARYNSGSYFANIYYIAIPIGLALIARPFVFRPRNIRFGEFFIPTLSVAIAITLGGLFHISFKEYFTMPAIYYVIGLGFGQLLINVVLESNVQQNADHTIYLSKMMVGVGVMGICMVLSTYIKNFDLIGSYKLREILQWGNNLSNNLLISMPFAFYLACKQQKFGWVYFIIGLLQYAAIVLGLSRGGIIFATISFPFAILAAIICAKKNRKSFIWVTIVCFAAAIIIALVFFLPQIKKLVSGLEISGKEVRVSLYGLAWRNFKKYPIFGAGLAYNPNIYYRPKPMCLYWYHSTLFQVLGSLGVVGVIAYSIQAFYRARALLRVKCRFNLFVAITMLGFAGYSMVNVGYFVPLPNMAILTMLFILVDRNNNYLKKNPKLLEQEFIFNKKLKNKII